MSDGRTSAAAQVYMIEIVYLVKGPWTFSQLPRACKETPKLIAVPEPNLLIKNSAPPESDWVEVPSLGARDSVSLCRAAYDLRRAPGHVLIASPSAVLLCQHLLGNEICQGRFRVHHSASSGHPFAVAIDDGKLLVFTLMHGKPSVYTDRM